MKKKAGIGQWILTIILSIWAAFCILPLILVVVVSFSSDESITNRGFTFFPESWSLAAWEYVLGFGQQLVTSYGVTIFVTVSATLLALIVETMFAYTLSRSCFRMRKYFALMMLVTMLFGGGQLSTYYVNVAWYKLSDKLLVLILGGVGAMHVIIFRTYIQGNVSESLIESAKIDGAGEFRTFTQIVLPCMLPVLASIGFMKAIGHWDAWSEAYLYIRSPEKTPLSLLLMKIEKNIEFLMANADTMDPVAYEEMAKNLPNESGRMAILLASLGPILVAYPFFQKYFVKGITVGSVKG